MKSLIQMCCVLTLLTSNAFAYGEEESPLELQLGGGIRIVGSELSRHMNNSLGVFTLSLGFGVRLSELPLVLEASGAIGAGGTSGGGGTEMLSVKEAKGGARYEFSLGDGHWSPRLYGRGGVMYISAEIEDDIEGFLGDTLHASDSTAGFYLGGGMFYYLDKSRAIAADVTYQRASVDMGTLESNVGGISAEVKVVFLL